MNANVPLRTKPRSTAGNGTPKAVASPAAEIEFPASHSFARLIREVYRAFNKALQIRLDRHGVTLGQWAFLRALWEEDGQTQRQLATQLGLKESTAMFSLNSLEKRGLIRRLDNADDRRKVNIRLTAKGWALRAVLLPYAKELNELALKGLSVRRVSDMRKGLASVLANVGADAEAQGAISTASKVRKRRSTSSRARSDS